MWFGPTNVQPIIALHGWQDNAGTFLRLAPMLPKDVSVLCIDLPGHGHSTHLPPGQSYYIFWDGVVFLRRIVKHYKWDKVRWRVSEFMPNTYCTYLVQNSWGTLLIIYLFIFNDRTCSDIVNVVMIQNKVSAAQIHHHSSVISFSNTCFNSMLSHLEIYFSYAHNFCHRFCANFTIIFMQI